MKIKLFVVLWLFVLATAITLPVTAEDPEIFTEGSYMIPVIEELNLTVDGSINPVLVNITKEFDYIMRIIWYLHWEENAIDYGEFGTGSALENGSCICYDGSSLNGYVKNIHDFSHWAYDLRIDSDDRVPKSNHLVSRLSFFKMSPPYGLKIKDGHTFSVVINDNIPSYCDDFAVTVQGFKIVEKDVEFTRSFIEEVLAIDNPIELVLFPFVPPLIFFFTYDPFYMAFGGSWLIIEFLFIIWLVKWRRG